MVAHWVKFIKICLTSGPTGIGIHFIYKTLFFTSLSRRFSSWCPYFPLSAMLIFAFELTQHLFSVMSMPFISYSLNFNHLSRPSTSPTLFRCLFHIENSSQWSLLPWINGSQTFLKIRITWRWE